MKNSNGLFNMETAGKYAKALAKYGLDLDLDESIDKFTDKYKENHSLKSNEENEYVEDDEFETEDDYLEEENESIGEESESKSTKAQEQRDLELSELRSKNDLKNTRGYNSILDNKSLRNAVILKEIIDNPRIEKRRKRYSRSRSGRI